MTDLLTTSLVATFALGLATWHLARVISDGALFEPLRQRVRLNWYGSRLNALHVSLNNCRLCLNTQVAILLTWGALVTGLVVEWYEPSSYPLAVWAFAFVVGPFLTAGWAEIIRRVECCEVKG
ncbi:hypothetical protein LCGC14_0532560 [marine sediment metagenome]|uniref:DUF1360 domain-containing protein n=1 Tax=marine sediment metagenome TaxID=412755 RepID=A0A0F9SDQ6_9ZZZZ